MARFTPDPSFYASPGAATAAPPEEVAYVAIAQHGHERRPRAGRDHRARRQGGLADVRAARRPARHAEHRRRAAPLRLERLLVRALPVGAAPARRAPLPARARAALLAHPRHRRQGRPAHPEDRQGDRGRGDRAQGGLQPTAHGPLRPGRDLRLRARRPGRRRAGRHLPARPRRLHRQGRSGRPTAGRRSSPTTSGGTSTSAR